MGQPQMGLTAERVGGIQQIRPWHSAIARYSVMGMRPDEIANVVDMTPAQISRVLGSPLMIAEIARLEAQAEYVAVDVANELRMRGGKALAAIDRGLVQGDDHKAAQVGFELLDRTGFGKTAKHVHAHAHAHLHRDVKEMDDEDLLNDVLNITEMEGSEEESYG